MRAAAKAGWPIVVLATAMAGCAAPQLGPANTDGLVVIRATVTVQCSKTEYAAPSAPAGSPQAPRADDSAPTGKRLPAEPLETMISLPADPHRGPYPILAWGHGGGMGHGGHGKFMAGAGGYIAYTPPCDDRPPRFAAADSVYEAWIESDGRRVEARSLNDLFIVAQVAPGRYRLSGLAYIYFFGDEFYARRLPDAFFSPERASTLTFRVEPGRPVYMGTVSIRVIREGPFHDRVEMSVEPDPDAEAKAWRELIARYPDSGWIRSISERLRSLTR